jgi:hypothetical protein
MHRRDFLRILGAAALAGAGRMSTRTAAAGHEPPSQRRAAYEVLVPPFMTPLISAYDIAYLNDVIPGLFVAYRDLFPMLDEPPQYIVLNTLAETLIAHGNAVIAAEQLGGEALTLSEAQYLLVTMRFGSVATPHRGTNLDLFGRYVYLKQHPRTGYRTPQPLLLEEIIHAQQDRTVMRHIIQQEALDPAMCMHGQLKGISELGAHYYTDELRGEPDYVFVLDDGTHLEDAAAALQRIAGRIGAQPETLLRAITYDAAAYAELDAGAVAQHGKHIWQMLTTWRYARDATGSATDIAPAFLAF